MSPSKELETELLSCLTQGKLPDHTFDELAQRIFSYQLEHNPAYQNYCSAKGISPEAVTYWNQIPALPTDAFKYPDTPVVSFPINQKSHTFLTSGTTSEMRGAHHFPSLALYEASIRHSWNELGLPECSCGIFLTQPPASTPSSSLSHMMGVLEPIIATRSAWILQQDGSLDTETLIRCVAEAQPIFLLGTALSFLQLFDNLTEPLALPEGSMAMETGGYKGSRRELEKAELYTLFADKLGLAENSIINEYSMTELSSQFYTHGIGNSHHGPPWTRIRVIDPRTGAESEQGMPGYLVVYDLANLHSVMAIQTQDIAIAHSDRSFTLIGRDPSALPRGCSRAADTQHPS